MKWQTEDKHGLKPGGYFRWGWLNVGGIKGSLEEVVQFISDHNFSFMILGETWLKQNDIFRSPSIVFDLRGTSNDPAKGRGVHEVMVIRNMKLTDEHDFSEFCRDEVNRSCIWFKFQGILSGVYYLPPSIELDTCIESLMITSDVREQTDREGPVFLG